MSAALSRRQGNLDYGSGTCYDTFHNAVPCSGGWYDWGRYVLAFATILGLVALFIAASCISARRRTRLGQTPRYGTGWASRPFPSKYNPNAGNANNTFQPLDQHTYANVHNNNRDSRYANGEYGYYGGGYQSSQTTGTTQQGFGGAGGVEPPSYEMQPPKQAYGNYSRGQDVGHGVGDDGFVYQPPAGPPPGKKF